MITYAMTQKLKEDVLPYDVWDSCYGTVTSCSCSGAYLTLDNGESAFAYKFTCLPAGTVVLCSVITPATDKKRTEVEIESVAYSPEIA